MGVLSWRWWPSQCRVSVGVGMALLACVASRGLAKGGVIGAMGDDRSFLAFAALRA